MSFAEQRHQIWEFLKLHSPQTDVSYHVHDEHLESGYTRLVITYPTRDDDLITAFLLIPGGNGPFPGLLIHHQHNSERHLGKSEVCGLTGDPLQAFGLEMVKRGFIVLAPDSICFEDRRRTAAGTQPDPSDTMQHFNEMSYRLVQGDTLMRKVLDDASLGLSLLASHPQVIPDRIGVMGHSYGGNTTIFQAALAERVRFACSSGAVCSYQHKITHNFGLEMALTIPGFAIRWDIHHLLECIAPRPLLVVSADEDANSQDADQIVDKARPAYENTGAATRLKHLRYDGQHAITRERFDAIVEWLEKLS